MAEKGTSPKGEWTAGIVAIIAALLLGGALPIGLYAGLYMPKVAERVKANEKLAALEDEHALMIARETRVGKLESEAATMEKLVREIEGPFAVADAEKLDVPDALSAIKTRAYNNNLELLPERKTQTGSPQVVYPSGTPRLTFEHGLRATRLVVEAHAYFHDFARFVSEIENMENFVVVPENLLCKGDTNGGPRHSFVMSIYVIERRDLSRVGK